MSKRYVAWLVLGLGAASCFPVLEEYGSQVPNQATPCTSQANCEDGNPCTIDVCQPDNTCARTNVDNGPLAQQIAGDCRRDDCVDGEVVSTNDDADVPEDNEPCTTDSCNVGTPTHAPVPDGMTCTMGTSPGKCDVGVCTVECSPTKPCNDMNPCTQDTCNASTGMCSFSPLDGLPTPGAMEMAGDCKQQICVNGVDTSFEDNADLPNDDNTCTKDACVNGMPVNTVISASGPCIASGTPGVCNAIGACIQCNVPQDCPAIVPANPCKQRTCTNNVCGVANVPGSVLPSQIGDCKKSSCDGNGNIAVTNDDADVPVDGNPCTKDVCTNGTPSHSPEASNFSCGAGAQVCDGMGQCTGCTINAECGVSDSCKTYACLMSKCVISYVAAGMPLPMNQQFPGDCKVLSCDGAGNLVTLVDVVDVSVDGNGCTQDRCDALGVPTFPPEPVNAPCAENGGSVCNGLGNCMKAPGANCADAAECITGFCTDGVCCMDTCTTGCMACNVPGSFGICSNVPVNGDDAPLCTGTNSCDGMGACKRDNGTACTMASQCASGFCTDGVCCNAACMETCKTCNRSGLVGTCSDVPNSSSDPNATTPCTVSNQCDGLGNCKKLNSVSCTQPSECLSGYCADGFCCNNICNQLCRACSNALTGATNGSCQPISNGADPQNECAGAATCNGAGMCTP